MIIYCFIVLEPIFPNIRLFLYQSYRFSRYIFSKVQNVTTSLSDLRKSNASKVSHFSTGFAVKFTRLGVSNFAYKNLKNFGVLHW
jgi:hypothetical protein